MMLPLEKRSNLLLSICIRVVSLDYGRYILEVVAANGKRILSNMTENTLIPKFELDRNNKDITNFLLSTDEINIKFVLHKEEEKIVEFNVDMGDLTLLCNDLSKARIKTYPIILFEFTEGFYTTKDLYINNTFNFQLESFNLMNNNMYINPNTANSANINNNIDNYNLNNVNNKLQRTDLSNIPILGVHHKNTLRKLNTMGNFNFYQNNNRKNVKFPTLNEKFKQYEFFDKQLKIINSDKNERIKLFNTKLQITQEAYSKYFKNYEKLKNINRMRNEMITLTEKIERYQITIEKIKRIISQKQSDLHISSSIFYLNRENYKDKVQYIEKNVKKIEKYKIMYNAFKNKKLVEIAFFFYNKQCYKFYLIPPFYKQEFDLMTRVIRYQYYEKYSQELSVMMGNISNLINYLSRLFNIPLKYPLFINGSRSFIVRERKDFIHLYYVPKNEDRSSKFELATVYLQENLCEILKYFHIQNKSEENINNSIVFNNSNSSSNLFSEFVKLSNFLTNMVNKTRIFDDI